MGLYRSERGEARVRAAYRDVIARLPVTVEERMLPTRHGETFVLSAGLPERPGVVLLHGSGGSSAMWADALAMWSSQFRVHAVDVVGEAGFSAQNRPTLASGSYIDWLGDVLDALQLGTTSLVGTSLGGWLALEFAVRHPDRIHRLALTSPCGVGRQRLSFLFRVVPLALLGAWGRRRALSITSGLRPSHADDGSSRYFEFLCEVQAHFRRRMEAVPMLDDAALRRLRMPVLAILGARDVILDSRGTRSRLEACVPHCEIDWRPSDGHVIVDAEPALLRFLAG